MTKSREIRTKSLKIMDLALKISPPDDEKVKGTPDVFVSYHPHSCALEVEVYNCGWKYGCGFDDCYLISTHKEGASKELDKAIEHLRKLRQDL